MCYTNLLWMGWLSHPPSFVHIALIYPAVHLSWAWDMSCIRMVLPIVCCLKYIAYWLYKFAVCYINLCPCIWVISLVILWFYEASYIRVLSDMHWMNHALIVVVFWFVWYIGHWIIGHLWDLIPILH